jgi:DNA polymerase III epsilon subunit-like protein
MFLIFDTETTGLPKSWNSPASDVANWPRLVQIAWETYDKRGKQTGAHSHIIKPEGFTIPSNATLVHGISTAKAKKVGRDLREVIGEFNLGIRDASIVVSHNIQFDENVVLAECHRLGMRSDFPNKTRICTMRQTTDFCRIPGQYGYKWPTLMELHTVVFGETCAETHDAGADVTICSKCFFELKRKGVLRVMEGGK